MNPYQKKFQNNKPQQTYTRQKPSAYTTEKYYSNGINQKQSGAVIDKPLVNINERAWMGESSDKKIIESKVQSSQYYHTQSPSTKQRQQSTTMQFPSNNDSPTSRLMNTMSRKSNTQKQQTPTQLMNDIFRSIGFNHLSTTKTYYSKQSQDFLTEILSNKAKMASYLKKLSLQMSEVSPEVEKNYEILMILLQQVGEADLEIYQDESRMRILFSRNELAQKQKEVERLQKELDEKNKQTEKIVQQYETVIRNFNDVIQKLIQQKKY